MKYGIFDQNQWLFPDVLRTDGKQEAQITLLKGQTGAFQVQISGLTVGAPICWTAEGLDGIDVRFYREMEVCVNRNTSDMLTSALTTDKWEDISRDRVRRAPYRTYDPLLPAEGLSAEKETEVYCIVLTPKKEVPAGTVQGTFRLTAGEDGLEIPVSVSVAGKELPESTLNLTNWLGLGSVAAKHGLEYGSDAHREMVRRYIMSMRDCHQNIYFVDFGPLKAEKVGGKPVFDFSGVKRWADLALECGMEKLEWAHIIGRASYFDPPFLISDITEPGKRLDCLSYDGRKYLTAFLDQFNTFLTENGWRDISMVHICDEPKERCADQYRILAGIFRKYLPGIKLMDAVEIFFIEDALDIYVPKNFYYQQNRHSFESLRDERNELWFYTCNQPGGRFLNRLMDSPLLNTRLLHWGNYRYNLTGYLHWAYFQVRAEQDAFEETSGDTWLPAGDTHIVYPGKDGPLMCLRWLQMKCGTEEYEILRALSATNRAKADTICRRAMYSFDDYVKDTDQFEEIRTDLVRAYEAEPAQ